MTRIDVLFTPAEFAALKDRDLSGTTCVVFDVLRATSSMVTALANGAIAIHPVEEIDQALRLRERDHLMLLAGERGGRRIRTETGILFDLGNSPREFTRDVVAGRTIAMTTTNGTRALVACRGAQSTWISSFLNLQATAERLSFETDELMLVCGGTFEEAAYEDALCAGGLIHLLKRDPAELSDAALLALKVYRMEESNLPKALAESRNGRRLLEQPDLRDDVAYCAQRDRLAVAARLGKDGSVRRAS